MRWLTRYFNRFQEDRLKERRGHERVSVHVPVRCQRPGGLLAGTLLELSVTGVRLELSTRVSSGDRFQLTPPPDWCYQGRRSVTCQVMWCRATAQGTFEAGLRHLATISGSWLEGRLQSQHQEGRSGRVHRRFEVQAPAQVVLSGGAPSAGRLMDVSLGGAQLRLAACPQPGQLVQLHLPGLTLVASVVGATEVSEDRAVVNLRFLKAQAGLKSLRRWLAKLPCEAAPGLCAA
jgi:hypothetical protein